jgi:hypothetical protein
MSSERPGFSGTLEVLPASAPSMSLSTADAVAALSLIAAPDVLGCLANELPNWQGFEAASRRNLRPRLAPPAARHRDAHGQPEWELPRSRRGRRSPPRRSRTERLGDRRPGRIQGRWPRGQRRRQHPRCFRRSDVRGGPQPRRPTPRLPARSRRRLRACRGLNPTADFRTRRGHYRSGAMRL